MAQHLQCLLDGDDGDPTKKHQHLLGIPPPVTSGRNATGVVKARSHDSSERRGYRRGAVRVQEKRPGSCVDMSRIRKRGYGGVGDPK